MHRNEDKEQLFRAQLRFNFNIEKICQKYEKIEECGAEVDLKTGDIYTVKGSNRAAVSKARQMYYNISENFGLAPVSAPSNSPEALDKNKTLIKKCKNRDEQFDEILAMTPFAPAPKVCSMRESVLEETFTTEAASLLDLENYIYSIRNEPEIVYRGIENDIATIRVRYPKKLEVISPKQNSASLEISIEGDNSLLFHIFIDEIATEFAQFEANQPLAITDGSVELNSQEIDLEIEKEFAAVETSISEINREFSTAEANCSLQDASRNIEDPLEALASCSEDLQLSISEVSGFDANADQEPRSRKRRSSLVISPEMEGCRSKKQKYSFGEENLYVQVDSFWNNPISDFIKSYIESKKVKRIIGVEKNILDGVNPNVSLLDFWVDATVLLKEQFPKAFSSEFIEKEARRQYCTVKEKNLRRQRGFVEQ